MTKIDIFDKVRKETTEFFFDEFEIDREYTVKLIKGTEEYKKNSKNKNCYLFFSGFILKGLDFPEDKLCDLYFPVKPFERQLQKISHLIPDKFDYFIFTFKRIRTSMRFINFKTE